LLGDVTTVVGIATEVPGSGCSSVDLALLRMERWTNEHEERAKMLREAGLFTSARRTESQEDEYPTPKETEGHETVLDWRKP
jgi:hypothetical protein